MSYLPRPVQEQLSQAFYENKFYIHPEEDYFVVENSSDQTQEKIAKIVESVGFCPLMSENKVHGNFAFTIVPYNIPGFFPSKLSSSSIPNDTHVPSASSPIQLRSERADCTYFNSEEIANLLKDSMFTGQSQSGMSKDRWSEINAFRSFVSSALNAGLSEVIARGSRKGYPIVELGSGVGYSLEGDIASEVVRIQPSAVDCQLLRESIASPVYQLDIAGLHNRLIGDGKKIPLFFALDVFDTLPSDLRRASLLQLSQLQDTGDRILIMLDTNPYIGPAVEELESLHPGHVALPYFPIAASDCTKTAVVLVPADLFPSKPSLSDLIDIIDEEIKNIAIKGRPSPAQYQLHRLQEQRDLKVVYLEDFFVSKIGSELEDIGYKTNVYYHAAFTTGEMPKKSSNINQDLLYRPVTDVRDTVKQWSLDDKNLLDALAKKGIQLPERFNPSFAASLRNKGHKMLGAEILVIEAVKS